MLWLYWFGIAWFYALTQLQSTFSHCIESQRRPYIPTILMWMPKIHLTYSFVIWNITIITFTVIYLIHPYSHNKHYHFFNGKYLIGLANDYYFTLSISAHRSLWNDIFIRRWEIINLKSGTTHLQFSKNINIVELWRLLSSIL